MQKFNKIFMVTLLSSVLFFALINYLLMASSSSPISEENLESQGKYIYFQLVKQLVKSKKAELEQSRGEGLLGFSVELSKGCSASGHSGPAAVCDEITNFLETHKALEILKFDNVEIFKVDGIPEEDKPALMKKLGEYESTNSFIIAALKKRRDESRRWRPGARSGDYMSFLIVNKINSDESLTEAVREGTIWKIVDRNNFIFSTIGQKIKEIYATKFN